METHTDGDENGQPSEKWLSDIPLCTESVEIPAGERQVKWGTIRSDGLYQKQTLPSQLQGNSKASWPQSHQGSQFTTLCNHFNKKWIVQKRA